MPDWKPACRAMIDRQVRQRGITNRRVLAALERVPRHRFVPPDQQARAYDDVALPIAAGQTISQPYIVALMADALQLHGDEQVLEIGAGSGYAAAVLAELAAHVTTIERHPNLAQAAQERLAQLGYRNITVVVGDGSLGWPSAAPYDAISVAAGAPQVPQPLLDQLAAGGRLVLPVGPEDHQELVLYVRHAANIEQQTLSAVRFVPLIGAEGWRDQTE